MKQLHIIIAALLISFSVAAQELTIEYNIGYGTYKMEKLGEFMENNTASSIPLKNMKITDDFPGYITHQANLGVEWGGLHQMGLSLGYLNTVWNKGVSDYSGSYDVRMRTKGYRLAPFYRIGLPDFRESLVRPYFQLSAGFIFNRGELEEIGVIGSSKDVESETLKGMNFFIEPAIGAKVRLHKLFALNVSVGYQFDATKKFKYEGQKATVHPDWSGLRVQGGLIYYVPLRR